MRNSIKKQEELKKALIELIELLDEFDVKNWCVYFEKALNAFESDPLLAAKIARDAYGGMGSFNDCILGYHNPVTPKGFSLSEKRIKFNELHSSIQRLSTEIIDSSSKEQDKLFLLASAVSLYSAIFAFNYHQILIGLLLSATALTISIFILARFIRRKLN